MSSTSSPPSNNDSNSSATTTPTTPTPTTTSTKGIAGRTDYATWDRLATDLVDQAELEEQAEIEQSRKLVGLDGKYARSAAEAAEREKLQRVAETKKKLETFQQREMALQQTFAGLLGPVVVVDDDSNNNNNNNKEKEENNHQSSASTTTKNKKKTIRLTRKDLQAGKRVVTLSDTTGSSLHHDHHHHDDTIVLTNDLSHLESKMAMTNPHAKSFADDAENAVVVEDVTAATAAGATKQQQQQQQRSIFGLIKVFLTNLHNCTVLIKCKVISGTLEIHNCSNVKVEIHADATIATIQADLSRNLHLEFHDAPSGKNIMTAASASANNNNNNNNNSNRRLYWGQDKDDRIFHAGVSNMSVKLFQDGMLEYETVADYCKDGATAIGNATPEEFQFVTSVVQDALVTEKVVRAGSSTGTNVRAMTDRELQSEKERREKAEKMAIAMAEDMVQIKDKDGNVLVQKTTTTTTEDTATASTAVQGKDVDVEEVLTDSVQDIIKECEQNKARGNEAFAAGEYGQAILLYTLALDKSDELGSCCSSSSKQQQQQQQHQSLFPRDIVYSNRAACFLKLGQHEKAQQDADQALQLNPDNIKANFRKGLALHAMKQYEEALPVLAAAHKMEPKNKQVKQALQFCEMRLQQEHRKRMMG